MSSGTDKLMRELGLLTMVMGFFSRIPLPSVATSLIPQDIELSDGANYFPVAGLVIGLLMAFVVMVFSWLLPMVLATGLALLFGAVLTGALHEDGLADCADGFGAGADRARTLEIMSDSRIGTYGTVAIVFAVGLKWMGLSAMTPAGAIAALVASHTIARAAIIPAMVFSRYAKPDGLGKMVDGQLPTHALWITIAIATAVSGLFAGWAGLVAVVAAYLVAGGVLAFLNAKFGGYTGDGLGTMEQAAEITVVLVLAGLWV